MREIKNISLLCVLAMLSSCIIKGESRNCVDGVRIKFSTNHNDTRAADIKQIKRIDLFAFDHNGVFIDKWSETFDYMPEGFEMVVPLQIGIYSFVAWGNLDEMFSTKPMEITPGVTKLDQVRVILQNKDGVVDYKINSLVFGELPMVEITDFGQQKFVVNLVNNTYKINVKTNNLITSQELFSLTITDQNGEINFDNSLAPSSLMTYKTLFDRDTENKLFASIETLKLYVPSAEMPRPIARIVIKNETSGDVVFPTQNENGDLIELIQRLEMAGQIVDFEKINEYTLTFKFDETNNANICVGININGWDVPIKSENQLEDF